MCVCVYVVVLAFIDWMLLGRQQEGMPSVL